MKKIMFNDRYGLTQAVLEGSKTMTRRIIPVDDTKGGILPVSYWNGKWCDAHGRPFKHQPYQVGEEVAVAQTYEQAGWNPDTLQQAWVKKPTLFPDLDEYSPMCGWVDLPLKYHKGWANKMFVLADLMPHRIRITNIKLERLQDISEQDCIREGIKICRSNHNGKVFFGEYTFDGWDDYSYMAKSAFAILINKISGRGTWDSNPWVFAYEFQKID